MTSQRRLRTVSWIAIFAIVASVFAPIAARAVAAWSAPGSPWDEICTSLGLTRASVAERDAERSPTPAPGSAARGECPYCLPSAQPVSVPAQAPSVPPAAEGGFARFLFFFISAPHSYSAPDSIRSRAPPQFA